MPMSTYALTRVKLGNGLTLTLRHALGQIFFGTCKGTICKNNINMREMLKMLTD
jgi:hypothetical protein